MRTPTTIVLLLALGLPANVCGQTMDTNPTRTSAAATAAADFQWVKYDAATKTVTVALIAGAPGSSSGPFNFNGFNSGTATLTVPGGSKVVINFVNQHGTPHSAPVVTGDGPTQYRGRRSDSGCVHPRRHTGSGSGRQRRHPVHCAGQRQVPHYLRRCGSRALRDVDLASKLVGYAVQPDAALNEITSVTIPYNSPQGLAGF
jgi:hypothetical protein